MSSENCRRSGLGVVESKVVVKEFDRTHIDKLTRCQHCKWSEEDIEGNGYPNGWWICFLPMPESLFQDGGIRGGSDWRRTRPEKTCAFGEEDHKHKTIDAIFKTKERLAK